MAFLGLSEFYNIRFGGQESAYAFSAGDNTDDWLYQSASHYSNYMLTSGLLFLITSLVVIWSMIKKKKLLLLISLSVITLLFVVNLLL